MGNFKCYECKQKFTDIKSVISHLKNIHSVKEKLSQIKCVNDFSINNLSYQCSKVFLTFSGLRKHLVQCCPIGKQFDLMVEYRWIM